MIGKPLFSAGESDERAEGEGSVTVPTPLARFLTPSKRLSDEEAFEILYNPRRRHTMAFLHRRGRPCSMEELVEHISATENGVPIGELSNQQRRRVYVSLYQTHLPLLDETGAIEYDQERQRIAPGPAAPELIPYLETPTERPVPWRAYYRWLLLAYAVVGGAAVAGLVPVPSVWALALGGVLLFLGLAALHGLDRRR
ncbi:DUF7344 domain-containing protein [Halalkalicoccus jeotgali]|uniref:DUF7344 domain-containing protein n=1 Tax=Halalkalicoccus jeotgali (strain DSM 18796 / CECT 7217 / JCM 14584 / KCTC 4019 / B3) TaxID=795797 RepID=D8J467_HALJB|nr:hypothetical protein [Halalkalicoccus jeotgali]ADJ15459.1 hypothetical protein HacjB3_10380 [Halalkalicoccus jeotgali B3]ELY36132.1 hypothetical protein C497_12287 [Halalkalicoccus jeotgali B3]